MGQFYDGLYEELSLYVRYSAWLNTATERPPQDKSNSPLLSRLEKYRIERKDADYSPDMPDVNAGYLVSYLWEVGPTEGDKPLSHSEIVSWMDLTGTPLHPWEVRFLRRLSHDYLIESHKAEKPDCPSPWATEAITQEQREAVSKQVQTAMRSFMTKRGS